MKKVIFLIGCFIGIQSYAQITVNTAVTGQSLADSLCGSGVVISNINYVSPGPLAAASFNSGGSLGINSGILLTTGSSSIAASLNTVPDAGFNHGAAGDSYIDQMVSGTSFDAHILEFDFLAVTDTVVFNYIFGSEEYNDFVNTGCNDAFAFLVSGPGIAGTQNIALIPGSLLPVSINNVNNGNSGGVSTGPCTNCTYFRDNVIAGFPVEYDGLTTVLSALAVLTPGQTYHLKLVIADVCDGIFDSGVFLEQGSMQAVGPVYMRINNTAFVPDTLMLHNGSSLTLRLPSGFNTQWSTGATSDSIVITQAGNYSAVISSPNLQWFRLVNPVNVVYFNLQAPVLTQSGTDLISSLNDSSLIYTWRLNGSIIPGANGPVYPFSQSGCYSVTATTMAGDSAISDTLCVSVTGLAELIKTEKLAVSPNPGSGSFYFTTPLSFKTGNCILSIYNATGRLVHSQVIQAGNPEAKFEISDPGMYMIRLQQDERSAAGMILVQ